MTDESSSSKPRPGEKPDRNPKKAAVVVALVILAVVAVVVILNRDSLLVHSDVTTPTTPTSTQPVVPNRAPEVLSITAATDRIEPFSICELECDAVDPDGDPLTYTWSVSAGEIYGDGPRIEWGSPVAEGLYRVSVIADDGRGGTAEYSTSLRVKANAAPVLASMTLDADWLPAGGSTHVSCEVSDANGDDITLAWSTTGGTLTGQGSAVMWTAPEKDGVYWIAVIARDAYGGEGRRMLPISVTSGEPPKIDGLYVHGVNTDMVQKVGNDWMVYQGRTLNIICAMVDESAIFTYEWSADVGTITADGATATWVAPAKRAAATILVVVADEKGNQSTASVLISVETCTCSF